MSTVTPPPGDQSMRIPLSLAVSLTGVVLSMTLVSTLLDQSERNLVMALLLLAVKRNREVLMMITTLPVATQAGGRRRGGGRRTTPPAGRRTRGGRGRGRQVHRLMDDSSCNYVFDRKARRFGRISWRVDYEPGMGSCVQFQPAIKLSMDGFFLIGLSHAAG